MKRRNIFKTVLCGLLAFLLLTGCSLTGDKEPSDVSTTEAGTTKEQDTTESTTVDVPEEKTTVETTQEETKASDDDIDYDESVELASLRLKLKMNNAIAGIAYLDFLSDTRNVSEFSLAIDCATGETLKEYPFLQRCPISFNEGNEVFALVPASKNATVMIYGSTIDSEGNTKDLKDKFLCESKNGTPIVFLCNDNENYSNIVIIIKDGDKTVEVRPMISLENGRDIARPAECYDFTCYDMRDYLEESFYYLENCVDEVKEYIDDGMSIQFGSKEFMYNHYALIYELGVYDEEGHFVSKREYLIDESYVATRKTGETDWVIITGGLDLDRVKLETGEG